MGNTLCKPAINTTDVILDEKIKDDPLLTEEAIKELVLPKVIEEDLPEVIEEDLPEVLPKVEDLPKDLPKVIEEDLPKVIEEDLPKVIEEVVEEVVLPKMIVETIITEICLCDIQRTEVISYEPDVVLGDVTKEEMSSTSSQDDPPLKKKRGRPKKSEV